MIMKDVQLNQENASRTKPTSPTQAISTRPKRARTNAKTVCSELLEYEKRKPILQAHNDTRAER